MASRAVFHKIPDRSALSATPISDRVAILDSYRWGEYMEKEEEPWKDICCKRCWFAMGKRCTCQCGGKYHGRGLLTKEHLEKDEFLSLLDRTSEDDAEVEQICLQLKKALEEHPLWEKYLEE